MKDAADRVTPELLPVNDSAPLFVVRASEMKMLRRLGAQAIALYLFVLKPAADGAGRVQGLTYKRMVQLLTQEQNRAGGHKPPPLTKEQLRGSLDRLEAAGLVWRDLKAARDDGELHIYLTVSR